MSIILSETLLSAGLSMVSGTAAATFFQSWSIQKDFRPILILLSELLSPLANELVKWYILRVYCAQKTRCVIVSIQCCTADTPFYTLHAELISIASLTAYAVCSDNLPTSCDNSQLTLNPPVTQHRLLVTFLTLFLKCP